MKKVLLKIFTWFFWKHFLSGLKSVLGHKTLALSIQEMNDIECVIRHENDLGFDEDITWENSKKTLRELLAKYATLKYFNEIGRLLAFFMAVAKKKKLKEK